MSTEQNNKSFNITDPQIIGKLDSLSPEEMDKLNSILRESLDELHREKNGVVENKCDKCPDGLIQHTSFPSPQNGGETTIHVYGCNRCVNGWSSEEK